MGGAAGGYWWAAETAAFSQGSRSRGLLSKAAEWVAKLGCEEGLGNSSRRSARVFLARYRYRVAHVA